MTVAQLIEALQILPPDAVVEVNDNRGGEVYPIEQVDFFEALEPDGPTVMIQVNC